MVECQIVPFQLLNLEWFQVTSVHIIMIYIKPFRLPIFLFYDWFRYIPSIGGAHQELI